MSATPFMQLYVADYLGDTRHLTTEQHGAYLLLLMAMWRAGGKLPADDEKLARIAGLALARWKRTCGDVMAFFTLVNGEITQKRLAAEIKKSQEKSQKRAEAGRLGGQAKSLKNNDEAQANATVLPEHSSDTRSHIEEPSVPSSSSFHSDDAVSQRGRERANARAGAEAPLFGEVLPPAGPSVPATALRLGFDASSFETWWFAYPHKVGKQDALKAFEAVVKAGRVSFDQLMNGLAAYKRTKPPDRAWCNPGTWLRQGRWDDEPASETAATPRVGGSFSRPSAAQSVVGGFAQALAKHPGSDFGRAARAQGFAGPDDC